MTELASNIVLNSPWRQAFPEYDEKALPGIALAGARGKEGLTQRELAQRVGLPQRHISEMERGKRPIGKEMARSWPRPWTSITASCFSGTGLRPVKHRLERLYH